MPTKLSWRRWTRGSLLAAIVGLAFWLRIGQATESLWLDELHTSWVVADGLGPLAPRAAVGNYSPAYFGLVWAVTKCVGENELALRLPSILAGTALVVGAWLVAVRWTGSWPAGLLAALLVAVDRHCVFYAQEARPYALVQLIGMAHLAVFAELVEKPRLAWRAAWIGTGLALFYLHYTAALLVAAEVVFYGLVRGMERLGWAGVRSSDAGGAGCGDGLANASGYAGGLADASGYDGGLADASGCEGRPTGGSGRYRRTQFVADLAVLGLGLAPAVPHLREIAQRRQDWSAFVKPRAWWRIWEIADVFPLDLYLLWPLGILALAWFWVWLFRRPRGAAPPGTGSSLRAPVLLLCWFVIPLGIAWVATAQGSTPLFFRRYLMVAALAPILAAAWCCAACPSAFWRWVLAAAIVALSVQRGGMVGQWRHDGRVIGDRNQDWRAAVRWVRERASADAPVFVRSGLIEAERWHSSPDSLRREYCLLPVLGLYRLDHRRESLFPLPLRPAAVLPAEGRRQMLACGQAWCLVLGDERSVARFAQDLRSAWQRAGISVREVQRFAFGRVTALRVNVGTAARGTRGTQPTRGTIRRPVL